MASDVEIVARGDSCLLWHEEPPPALDDVQRRSLNAAWERGLAELGDALHDSPILVYRSHKTAAGLTTIRGAYWPYRYYYAQCHGADTCFGAEPVGVSGLSLLSEGRGRTMAIGRRAADVAHYPGRWECIPSGGVDDSYARPDGTVDFAAMLLHEFEEEACLPADCVQRVTPFAVIYDSIARTYDICCELEVHTTEEELVRAARRSPEYTEVIIVPEHELAVCLRRLGDSLIPLSRAMIELHCEADAP